MDIEYDTMFWIKFGILSVPLIIMMWFMAPTVKWKMLFSLAVPVGVWLALSGRSIKGVTPLGRKY